MITHIFIYVGFTPTQTTLANMFECFDLGMINTIMSILKQRNHLFVVVDLKARDLVVHIRSYCASTLMYVWMCSTYCGLWHSNSDP